MVALYGDQRYVPQQGTSVMPAWAVIAMLAAAAAASFVIFHRLANGQAKAMAACACVTVVAGLALSVVICARGMFHGMQGLGMTLPAIERSTDLSPCDQAHELGSADEVPGHIIVLYRFACPDCEDAYGAIRDAVRGQDVMWVSSRSDVGHELCERYDVEWVPSVLSVSSDGHAVVRDLYADDLSGLDAAFDNLRIGD